MYVLGGSRGSEAALLLGAHYPTLVHGVIASSPSDVSFGSYPRAGSAAWTFHGRPVPYTSASVSANVPADDPAAAIPVQDIRGPVFLDCGTDDQIWDSCAYALRIENHLTAARFAYPHVLYRYQGAGHWVNGLVPYEPGWSPRARQAHQLRRHASRRRQRARPPLAATARLPGTSGRTDGRGHSAVDRAATHSPVRVTAGVRCRR